MVDPFVFLMTDSAHRGLSIAVAGMLIVAVALTVISLFIAALPKLLGYAAKVWPESESHRAAASHHERLDPHDEVLYAAIGYALYLKHQKH